MQGRDREERLLAAFGRLAAREQETLIAFAEFLAERGVARPAAEPIAIAAPEGETVTMAIRRLARTYPMLDRRALLPEAARFVAEHALEGRPAAEVIRELEAVFARHYERHRSAGGGQGAQG